MTFKQARAIARSGISGSYIGIHKQKELGWYVSKSPDQRTVYWVRIDGRLTTINTNFAKTYKQQYLKKKIKIS